jgi:hypothetical protein
MTDITATAPTSSGMKWTGWGLTGFSLLFLAMDAGMKLAGAAPSIETTEALGYSGSVVFPLGLVLAACTILYAIPRTAVLGAVLLTAYLGGAVATHVRIGSPLFTHVLFGVYVGLFVWGGLWLRSPKLRALMPVGRA